MLDNGRQSPAQSSSSVLKRLLSLLLLMIPKNIIPRYYFILSLRHSFLPDQLLRPCTSR